MHRFSDAIGLVIYINRDDTKLVWIGKMIFHAKLSVCSKLQLGPRQFTLLGINFSVDFTEMIDFNL